MNAPTLIIGLGGKGSDIVLRVSKMVRTMPEEQQRKIGFAVFDTDVNELKEIQKNNPFVRTIQTSTKLTVGEYLEKDTHSRDTWFPVNAILNGKALTEGAGQVRAISRLAFETAVKAGKMEPLHKAIEDLYKLEGEENQQALRVIIVSSLAGGTGSGIILPVALYVRNYLKTHFAQAANIVRGFFLLPEVFYGVIPGAAERNNLKCNAYATLRELDAFLMKGDATLEERYKDTVKIEFPTVNSNEYEEYNVRPFDFCFLFDAQNADGKKLNSFNQYLDHAASCIYAQSIGPMNKRSNSSEDNTIRKLVEEKGRNRYAGAGTSMLIYPVDDVKEYLALKWAKESISEQWLTYDKEFKRKKQDIANMRREGIRVHDITANKNYVETIIQRAKNKDEFAGAIVSACGQYDEDEVEKLCDTWEVYLDKLESKIKADNSHGQPILDEAKRSVSTKIGELGDPETIKKGKEAWKEYQDAYGMLERYRNLVVKNANEIAYTIAYTLFKSENIATGSEKLDYQIESHLRKKNGEFIHPNAVRYFLYNILDLMEKTSDMVERKCEKAIKFFDGFDDMYFDDKETDDIVETVNDLARVKKIKLSDKIRRKLSSDQEDLINGYNEYLNHINNYRVDAIYNVVLKEGIEYIKKMCTAFENFFISLDGKISSIDRRIIGIEKKYDYIKGTATRYVCASSKCLKAMSKDMPYTGSMIDIDGKLAENIYQRVRKYAMMQGKADDYNYFSDLFDEGILGHFRNDLMEKYGVLVDMDIIDAIEKEGEYEQGIVLADEKSHYVKKVFGESKILAAPFIEKPMGEEKQPINSCTYNNMLNPRDDSPKAMLIDSELKNFGGEEDEDISKNMILFYKSFYGLRATDLSKFAPPHISETYNRNAGEYFKAYYELVGNIYPRADKSIVITPHIDKWWHNVSKMPDLDDKNQYDQENEIYKALFWGLIGNFVELTKNSSGEGAYSLKVDELNMPGELNTLVVSNGTPCDKLYEVLDSMAIYPKLVININEKVENIISADGEDRIQAEDCKAFKWINNFRVEEYPLEKEMIRSVFDLPLLIKRNMPSELYYEERIIKILKVELAEIIRCAEALCDSQDANKVAAKLISEQFDKMIENIEFEKDEYTNFYQSVIFDRFCTIIQKTIRDLNLKEEAAIIEDKVEKIKLNN